MEEGPVLRIGDRKVQGRKRVISAEGMASAKVWR